MSCARDFGTRAVTLYADTLSNATPTWLTPARPAQGLSFIDAVIVPVTVTGNAQAQLVVQFFEADLNAPSSPITIGGATASISKVFRDCTTEAGQNAFYRIGIAPSLSSGSTPGSLTVSVQGSAKYCGSIIGSISIDQAPTPANVSRVLPITSPFPARRFGSVSAVIRVIGKSSSTSGNLKTRLMARSFVSELTAPSSWSPLEAFDTVTGSNDERHVNSVSPSLSPDTNMWGQLGLALEPTTNDLSAMVQVLTMGAS